MGLVTLSDVRKVPREEWRSTPVSVVMTPVSELRTVAPDDDLRSALRILAENDYHQLPVVENGRLAGMLNRAHVMQYLHLRQRLGVQETGGPTGPTVAGRAG
jgi:CBS domain-containing protein